MGAKMKISIFVLFFPPKRLGGTEIATFNIAKNLAKEHEVHVFTRLDEGLQRESFTEGFYVHRIYWSKIKFFGGLLFWMNAVSLLLKIKPDIIHIQTMDFGKTLYFLNKLFRKPVVIWARGSDVNYLSSDKKDWKLKGPLKSANALISLTNDMKKKIQNVINREVFVIPNGINLDSFKGLSKDLYQQKYRFKKEIKTILYVGTLRSVKGLSYLIEAMRIINDENIRLFIIGRGDERRYLEELVKKYNIEHIVTFVGRIPNKEVFEYMASSDVLVLPSLSEGFPNVILEAMASGLPIISTNVGGLSEIINNNENGFLVDSKNPEQISEKILLLFNNEELRIKISKNNLEKVKNYSWESVIDRLEKIYFDIIKINDI
jgi:glycosyltransferase involved in cell wall biosynthesis